MRLNNMHFLSWWPLVEKILVTIEADESVEGTEKEPDELDIITHKAWRIVNKKTCTIMWLCTKPQWQHLLLMLTPNLKPNLWDWISAAEWPSNRDFISANVTHQNLLTSLFKRSFMAMPNSKQLTSTLTTTSVKDVILIHPIMPSKHCSSLRLLNYPLKLSLIFSHLLPISWSVWTSLLWNPSVLRLHWSSKAETQSLQDTSLMVTEKAHLYLLSVLVPVWILFATWCFVGNHD